MNLRAFSAIGAVGAFLVPFLLSETASAQSADGLRFRGGVDLEVGGNFLVGSGISGNSGAIDVVGQLGLQITHNWAAYAVPQLGFVFGGGVTGLNVGAGVLADYMFDSIPISVSAGPVFGALVGIGGGAVGTAPVAGIKLGGAWYPILTKGDDGVRRKGLYVGVNLTIDGYLESGVSGIVLISPVVSVGYLAF